MRKCLYLPLLLCFVGVVASAQPSLVANVDEKNRALKGYDAVSYFSGKAPLVGHDSLVSVYQDARYYFNSEENRALFKQAPEQYAPQYGGWCAYAMGKSKNKVDSHPEAFKIIGNRLYLFYRSAYYDAAQKWNQAEDTLLVQADETWRRMSQK